MKDAPGRFSFPGFRLEKRNYKLEAAIMSRKVGTGAV